MKQKKALPALPRSMVAAFLLPLSACQTSGGTDKDVKFIGQKSPPWRSPNQNAKSIILPIITSFFSPKINEALRQGLIRTASNTQPQRREGRFVLPLGLCRVVIR